MPTSMSSSMRCEVETFCSELQSSVESRDKSHVLLSMLPLINKWSHENAVEWRETLREHLDLGLIVECLFDNNKQTIEDAVRVVNALAGFIGPLTFIRQCDERLVEVLRTSDSRLNASKTCVLNSLLVKSVGIDQCTTLIKHPKLVAAAVECLRHPELEVAHETMKLLLEASKAKRSAVQSAAKEDEDSNADQYCQIFENPILPLLHKLAGDEDAIVRMRVFDVVVNAVAIRPKLIKTASSEGFLGLLCAEMNGDDVLIKLNVLELLSQLAAIEEGLHYLDENVAVLNDLSLFFDRPNLEDTMVNLLLPGYIKLFGCVSKLHRDDCLQRYPHFGSFVKATVESKSDLTPVIIESLAHMCSNVWKKIELQNSHLALIKSTSELLALQMQQGSQEARVEALNLLSRFVQSNNEQLMDEKTSRLIEDFNQIFIENLNVDVFALLLQLCKQPFKDVSIAALKVLEVLSNQGWSYKLIVLEAGLLEFLLDRNALNNKVALEARFEIVRNLASRLEGEQWVSESNLERIKEFVNQGVFAGTHNLEVAIEEA